MPQGICQYIYYLQNDFYMIARVLLISTFLFLFTIAYAQKQNKSLDFYNAGVALMEKKKFSEAINAFKAAINLNKRYDSAYFQLGNIYFIGNKDTLALKNYKKALSINPTMAGALFSCGKIFRYFSRNTDSAIHYYRAAALYDKTNKEILNNLAWGFNDKTNYDSAISYAIKSLEIDNNYKPAYGELGYAYRQSKRFADAIIQFKKNLAISTVDVAIQYTGFCYVELNNKAAALEQYEVLLKINTKMAAALKREIDKLK